MALAGGCGGDARQPAAAAPAPAPPGANATLPLPLGFYVGSDTPCGEASNATLALLHREGLNGAREFCRFATLERTGPDTFRATESCSATGTGEEWSIAVEWEILGPTAFRRTSEEGWVSEFRFCEQASLPEPWRDNDISELTGQAARVGA
ncbi:MAG: hypothetical protein MUC71_09555 [Steroidobacteraceae bacterium]|nr:hypothetical protein [Steroidobacteraceae bacterium]